MKQQIIYIFNSSTSKGKRLSAISLVVDKVLQEHANQNLCFDFESPEIPQVAEFYGRFGSTATPFASVSYNNLPLPVRGVKALRARLYKTFIGKGKNNSSIILLHNAGRCLLAI